MLGSRVSRHIDAGRLSLLVSRPGVDPRIWSSLAVALGDSVMDSENGVFVDVQLMPTGDQYTARVAADYAGKGFGFYAGTIHQDDELLVESPSGDPAIGIVVVRRLFSAAELPPQDAIDNPADVCLTVEKDCNLRLRVQGQGQVFITTAGADVTVSTGGGDVTMDSGGGSVYLAENSDDALPTDGVVQGAGIDPFTGQTYTALQNTSTVVFAAKGS